MLYKRKMAAGCLSYKTGVCVHMQQALFVPGQMRNPFCVYMQSWREDDRVHSETHLSLNMFTITAQSDGL